MMKDRDRIKITILLIFGFAVTLPLSGQQTSVMKDVRIVRKYKYTLPMAPLNGLDSTRKLSLQDLEMIEYFDRNNVKLKTEKYRFGKRISLEVYNQENASNFLTQERKDTLKIKPDYDAKSTYGAEQKFLEESGLLPVPSEEKYETLYNSNGELVKEIILNLRGDTLRSFHYSYDDTGRLLRTEEYRLGQLNSSRIYLGGGKTPWSRVILFDGNGEIASDELTRFYKDSPFVQRSETMFRWGEEENNQSKRNAIFFMNEAEEVIKAVYEVNDVLVVYEFHYQMVSNP